MNTTTHPPTPPPIIAPPLATGAAEDAAAPVALCRRIDLGCNSTHVASHDANDPRRPITVFTNGCFDLFHAGHVDLLRQARALGDRLVVGINSDDSVRRLKGPTRPIHSLQDRCEIVAACRYVDEVHPFHEQTPCHLIRQLHPQIIVKGPGYSEQTMPEAAVVKEWGGKVVVLPGPPISTTSIIERIHTRA